MKYIKYIIIISFLLSGFGFSISKGSLYENGHAENPEITVKHSSENLPFKKKGTIDSELFEPNSRKFQAKDNPTATRPNILFVFIDDLDHEALGFMDNSIIKTPHIDQLADEGVVFKNAFTVTATCVTSRGALMTGQYAARTGIYFDQFDELTEEQAKMTFPAILRQSGYHTGYVGKWHLGQYREGIFDDDRAYDGQGFFWSEDNPPEHGTHLTDRLGNQAVSIIHDAPVDKPFMVTVGFKAPHVQDGFHPVEPYPASPATSVMYELDEIPAPPLSDPAFFESQPEFLQNSLNRVRWDYRLGTPESLNFQRSMRRYYRMVSGVDRQIGKMMEALRETNRLENTIVVLTSDHGMYLGDRGFAGKWLGHDTSIRIPLIVRDPGLREAEVGTERQQMVLMIDLLPTFLDWAGLPTPDRAQGRSIVPIVNGKDTTDWRTEFFYEHHSFPDRIPRSEGIRTERYKYLRYIDTDPLYEELYDLKEDPEEANNLAGHSDYAQILQQMRDKWEQWNESVR